MVLLGRLLVQLYLQQAILPKLLIFSLEVLEGEITTFELCSVLKSMANGNAPGPGGLTVSYYRVFSDTLIPCLAAYANSISNGGALRSETFHAHITVLPKPGKDPSACGSYRLISLLKIDAKLFAKVLANRLLPLIP